MMKITMGDRTTISDFEEIKSVSRIHYDALYTQSEETNTANIQFMLEHIPTLIAREENHDLKRPISNPT
jgi:hypothetical protein